MSEQRENTAYKGEWAMDLETGVYWHSVCSKVKRKGSTLPPYCSNCNTTIPGEVLNYFTATWHLLNLGKKQR